MPVVISQNFVLTQPDDEFPVTLDHPVIGWHNIVTAASILAGSELVNYPASNLANPATHLEWRGTAALEHNVYFTTDYVDEIDYIAVARHNFGSAQIAVSIEGYVDGVWSSLIAEHMLANDAPVLYRFTPQSLAKVNLHLAAGLQAPRAAVVYVGKLLTLERRIWVGHTPMPHARKSEDVNGMSETGNFLGRIQLGAWRETTIPLSLISPRWYRENMDEFLAAVSELPFFFAWRPQTYPLEVAYCWTTENPMPAPQAPSNKIAFDLKVRGIV